MNRRPLLPKSAFHERKTWATAIGTSSQWFWFNEESRVASDTHARHFCKKNLPNYGSLRIGPRLIQSTRGPLRPLSASAETLVDFCDAIFAFSWRVVHRHSTGFWRTLYQAVSARRDWCNSTIPCTRCPRSRRIPFAWCSPQPTAPRCRFRQANHD